MSMTIVGAKARDRSPLVEPSSGTHLLERGLDPGLDVERGLVSAMVARGGNRRW